MSRSLSIDKRLRMKARDFARAMRARRYESRPGELER